MWYQIYRQYKEGKITFEEINIRCEFYHVSSEDRMQIFIWLYKYKRVTKEEFKQHVIDGCITPEEYEQITGEEYIDNSEDTQDN